MDPLVIIRELKKGLFLSYFKINVMTPRSQLLILTETMNVKESNWHRLSAREGMFGTCQSTPVVEQLQ